MHRLATALFAAIIACVAANAADLPVKDPVYKTPAAAASSWTGFYIGGNVGGGWGRTSVHSLANDPVTEMMFNTSGSMPPSASVNASGVLGGIQFGYNWQAARQWMIGVETDFDWSGIKGSKTDTGTFFADPFAGLSPYAAPFGEKVKWFGTVRARVGYLPTERLLAFITGGLAYGRITYSGSFVSGASSGGIGIGGFGLDCDHDATCFAGALSKTKVGWTIGGGLEYALWGHLSVKAEYLYINLSGANSVTETALSVFPAIFRPASFNANFNRTSFNVARLGLNYRF